MKYSKLLEDIYASQYKIKKVHSQNPTTGDWEWHDRKVRTGRINFKNSKMAGEPAQKDDKNMKEETMTIDEQINEVLSKDATAGDWIHDFVHSDNPKFADKSKDKRKEMALAAYYSKQRNEAVINFPKTKDDHPRVITAHDTEHAWALKHVSKNKDDKISYQHNGVTIHHPDGKHTFILGGHKPLFDRDSKGKLSFKKDLGAASRAYVMPTKSANKNNVVSLKKEEVDLEEAKDEREYGYEGDMALNQLKTLTRCAEMITDMLKPDTDLPEWVQSKITLATDYIQTAADYLYSEMNEEVKDEYARKVDKHLKNKYAPVAPVPDRKYIKGTPENKALKASRKPINGHPTNIKEGTMKSFKEVMQSIQEANHREFAQQGKMHHDMAKHMNPGHEMDFYHPTTGDKMSGVVKHNSGKEVHIKANKDGKLGAGDVHKFTVTNKLDEVLVGGQKKLDKNKNGKVDAHDFKILRGEQEVNKEEVETRTVSFSDFITQLNEYTPGKDGVTRIQGKSYGAQYRDPEGEDDAFDRKPKQVAKPEPEVKRGRGRPAGSKSGANQKVTSGTKRSGVDYSGYKLHLPNSNR
jgi:hypothetical protein